MAKLRFLTKEVLAIAKKRKGLPGATRKELSTSLKDIRKKRGFAAGRISNIQRG